MSCAPLSAGGHDGAASRLSIVQLVENLDVGGLERFAIDLAKAQLQAGHASSIVCLFGQGRLAEEARGAGISVEALEKPLSFHPATIWKLARSLRRSRADVLHMHNPGVHHYGALAARLAGTGAVLNTRHGVSTSNGRPFNERFFRWTLPLTGRVIYVSGHTERHFVETGVVRPGQGTTIWNGIPLGAFLARPARPGQGSRLRLAAIGRLVAMKGHSVLLEALAAALPRLPDCELTVWGDGPLREELQRKIHAVGIGGRARLAGETRDVAGALAQADLLVLPSLSEGLPIVILEAMAAGVPIVSTRVGGVAEVAPEGEVAWYCAPGEVAALSEALVTAAHSGELGRRGERARALAVEKYAIESVQKQYESVYRQLLGRP